MTVALRRERQLVNTLTEDIDRFNAMVSMRTMNRTFAQRINDKSIELETISSWVSNASTQEGNLDQRLELVTDSIDEIRNKSVEIWSHLMIANSTAVSARDVATRIEYLVNESKVKITRAYRLSTNDSQLTVDTIRSLESSVVQLANITSSLVYDAENEASRQRRQATVLDDKANRTHQSAANAKLTTENAIASQNSDKKQLDTLEILSVNRSLGYIEAKSKVTKSKVNIEKAAMEAEDVHTRATELHANMRLGRLQEQLGYAQRKTTSLMNQLSTTTTRFSSVVNAITVSRANTSRLSRDIHISVDRVDYLIRRADEAYDKAMESVAKGRKIISDAMDTLDILTNFSQVINVTRSRAMKALRRVNTIEELSHNATAAAHDISMEHQQALIDAMMSMRLAEGALKTAQDALMTTTEIENDIMALKTSAIAHRHKAEGFSSNATTLNMTAYGLLLSCSNTTAQVDSTVSDIKNTISNQTDCSTAISRSGMEVERLQHDITNFKQLDDRRIASLQLEFTRFSDQLSDSALVHMVTALETQQREDFTEINNCNSLISELEQDVDNLEKTVAAGADICIGV